MADLPTGNLILNEDEEKDKTDNLINSLPKDVSGTPGPGEFIEPELKDKPIPPPRSSEFIDAELKGKPADEFREPELKDKPVPPPFNEEAKEISPETIDAVNQLWLNSTPKNDVDNSSVEEEVNYIWKSKAQKRYDAIAAFVNEVNNTGGEVLLANPEKELDSEGSWLEETADFLYYGGQGLKSAFSQTFNLDLDIDKPNENDLSDTMGYVIGNETPAMAAGFIATAALGATGVGAGPALITGAKVTRSAGLIHRTFVAAGRSKKFATVAAPLVAFELGYGITSQITRDLKDPLLTDLFAKNQEKWTPEEQERFLTRGFAEPEYVRRLKMAGTDATLGLGIGAIMQRVGSVIAKRYTTGRIEYVSSVMTGSSDNILSQQQRLEAYLVSEKGLTVGEAISRVTTARIGDPEITLEQILKSIDPKASLKEVDDFVKGNTQLRKEIYARNLTQTQLTFTGKAGKEIPMDAHNAAVVVDGWKQTGILDRKIQELSGRAFGEVLEEADKLASKRLANQGAGKSVIMGRTKEFFRVSLEDSSKIDAELQYLLTGVGGSAKAIERAYAKGAAKEYLDDLSQSSYILSTTSLQRITARLTGALKADTPLSKFTPSLPTIDGSVKISSAKSLGNIQKESGMDDKTFDGFLAYVRAKKIHNDLVKNKYASPIPKEELERIIAKGNANEQYKQALPEFSQLMKYLLEYSQAAGEKSGLDIKKMIRAATNAEGEFVYIPRHVAEESGPRGAYNYLSGTEKTLKDAYTDIIEQISLVIHKGDDNIIKAARYKMINKAANESSSSNIRALANRIATEVDIDKIVKGYGAKISKEGKTFQQIRTQAIGMHRKAMAQSKDSKVIDIFFDQGKVRAYEIIDPALERLVKLRSPIEGGVDDLAEGFVKFAEMLAKPTRVFTSAITKVPPFAIKSFIRDGIFAEFASPIGMLPRGRSIQGLFTLVFNRKVIKEMADSGFQAGSQITEVGKKMKSLDRLTAAGATAEEISKAERGNFLSKLAGGTVRNWTNFINNAEMASRVGEYMVAKKAGMSPQLATFFANDTSVNFAKTGTSSSWRTFTDMQAFFRPTYLGMSKTAEVIANNPLKASVYIGAMGAMLNSMNSVNSLYPDWSNKTEEERRLWIYLPNVDSKAFVKWVASGMQGQPPERDKDAPWMTIPAVHELQVLSGSLSRAFNLVTGRAENDSTVKLLADTLQGLIPPMSTYGVVPSLLSPSVDIIRNKSMFGTPILQPGQQNSPFKEDMINPTTGAAAIWLSNVSKKFDGMFGHPEALFTPIQAEYFTKNLLVGAAEYVKNGLDWWAREDGRGDLPSTPKGDKSRQVNFAKWVSEETAAIFYDSSLAGRGYKGFVYEMQALSNRYRTARNKNTSTFLRTFGDSKIRDYDGVERMLKTSSPYIRKVLDAVREFDMKIHRANNSTGLSPDQKLIKNRAYKSAQDMAIERFIKNIDRMDPNKDLKAWGKLAPTTKRNK